MRARSGARLAGRARPTASAALPVFSLGGLSKACGLPHLKLGWIVVGGPDAPATLAALELIADTYLSVGAPVQAALRGSAGAGRATSGPRSRRVSPATARHWRRALAAASGCNVLPAEAGWSAIVRVPATRTDEAWATALVTQAGVLVHPGYFFDLRGGTFLVVSLLPAPGAVRGGDPTTGRPSRHIMRSWSRRSSLFASCCSPSKRVPLTHT